MRTFGILGLTGLLSTQLLHTTTASPITTSNHPVSARDVSLQSVDAPIEERQLEPVLGAALVIFYLSVAIWVSADQIANAYHGISEGLVEAARDKRADPGPHCFESGSWSYNVDVVQSMSAVCVAQKNSPASFNFGQTNGVLQGYDVTAVNGTALLNEAGMNQNMSYTGTFIQGATRNNQDDCLNAMNWIVEACTGNHQDTRGGYYYYDDGSLYSVDPTCNDPGKCGSAS
ncbi:MAG: hypothetical protein M1827_006490 [Pycnora praestabilis]|nr:MAG: hypothetical protein M1827_006490 [Pycnora praestabilis]